MGVTSEKLPNMVAKPVARSRPVCLLSLDGGGIRGISAIVILREIMRHVNQGKPPNEHLQPWQFFDLIGGTSTGGIIAIMIGCLRMTLDECESAYLTMAKKIFQPKRSKMSPLRFLDIYQANERFDSRSMEKVLKDIIAKRTGSSTTKLKGHETNKFVTSVRVEDQELCLLRSYDNPQQPLPSETDWELWEALRATSAANTYFKEHRKGNSGFLDGALKSNNPIYSVMAEANELWDMPEVLMVSIGTGQKNAAPIQGNIMKLAKTLTKTLINPADTDRNFRRAHRKLAENGFLYRFNVPSLGHVKLEDYKSIPSVILETERYLTEVLMLNDVKKCSQRVREILTPEPVSVEKPDTAKLTDLTQDEKGKKVSNVIPRTVAKLCEDCLRLLHAVAGDYESQRTSIDKSVPGTCDWFLKHTKVSAWWEDENPSLLWVTANPGCGKSVLSNYLVQNLDRAIPNATFCFFFFKAGEQNRSESHQALCALIHQLLRKFPAAAKVILEAFTGQDASLITTNVEGLWKILKDIMSAIDSQRVFFIIDGLDECSEASRNRFIDILASTFPQTDLREEFPEKLKILATSRPWPVIEKRFKHLSTIRLRSEDENHISKDIEKMVKYKVQELSQDGMLSPETSTLVEERLLSGADQTFLWVSLVLENISRLHSLTYKSVKKALESVPNDLGQLYESALRQFRDQEASLKLLRFVVVAKNPLHLEEINVAMNISLESESLDSLEENLEPDMEYTTKLLGGFFLRIIDSKVHLVHQTAREFLLRDSGDPTGLASSPVRYDDGEVELAEACIRFVTLEGIPERQNLPSKDEDLNKENQQYLSNLPIWARRFYAYAATFWGATSGAQTAVVRDNRVKQWAQLLCNTSEKVFNSWWWFYLSGRLFFGGRLFSCQNLHFAHLTTLRGHLFITKALVETGSCSISAKSSEDMDILVIAARENQSNHVEWLLDTFPHSTLQLGPALLAAVLAPNICILQAMIRTGVELNATYRYKGEDCTAGVRAACRPKRLQVLLEEGLVITDEQIMQSAYFGYPESLKLQLCNYSREGDQRKTIINKALREAVHWGYVDCLDVIVEQAPDLITEMPDISTGLEQIILRCDETNLNKLLERGADTSEALKVTSQLAHIQSTKMILKARQYSKPQLDEALDAWFEVHLSLDMEAYVTRTMRQVMASEDRSRRLHNGFRFLPSFGAEDNDSRSFVNLYLERGAEISTEQFVRATSLVIALDGTFAMFLLENKDTLQKNSVRLQDFLFVACIWGKHAVVETILSMDAASLGQRDGLGMTPIFAAVASGNPKVVSLLLRSGANARESIRCSSAIEGNLSSSPLTRFASQFIDCLGGCLEETPLSLARRLGYADIEKLLEAS
ncbi:hypothetical protein G7046_g4511 [Stylonectria norvegica]|nr:hypothetical protein G7046_g4511 [Stylonectria norvegica]